MNYKKYQHIEKLGTSPVEGILKGVCHLFYKIDGTNSSVFLKEKNTLGFGGRKRELTIEKDNAGFVASFLLNKEIYNKILEYLTRYPERIIYGEWLIPVTIKRYNKDAWRRFYIFDIYDDETKSYIPYDEYKVDLDRLELDYVPKIVSLTNPTVEEILSYLDRTGDFLITEGAGEGMVIKNYDFINSEKERIWAKVLSEDFRNDKKSYRNTNHQNKTEHPVEHKIVTGFLTPEFVQKEKSKLIEETGSWNSKMISVLLNRVFIEFWKDNWELIFKKFKYPTIDFKSLKRLVDEFVKLVLNI